MANLLFDALKEIKEKEERKKPKVIYLDEKDGKVKEKPLSLKDSAGSYIYKRNPVKEIHDAIFS
jgi:hypothetical protein